MGRKSLQAVPGIEKSLGIVGLTLAALPSSRLGRHCLGRPHLKFREAELSGGRFRQENASLLTRTVQRLRAPSNYAKVRSHTCARPPARDIGGVRGGGRVLERGATPLVDLH